MTPEHDPDSHLHNKLPVTEAVVVTESSFPVFGLKGFGFAWVFIVFIVIAGFCQNFPLGLICAGLTYVFIKRMIDDKPRYYLVHLARFVLVVPKFLYHRPGWPHAVSPGLCDTPPSPPRFPEAL
jgi:hypothetical protein